MIRANKKDALGLIHLWTQGPMAALSIMEIIWITVWYQAILSYRLPTLLIGIILLIIVFISRELARHLFKSRFPMLFRWIIFSLWLIFVLLLTLPMMLNPGSTISIQNLLHPAVYFRSDTLDISAYLHLLIISILIWRGASMANLTVGLENVTSSFLTGMILFGMFSIVFPKTSAINFLIPFLLFLFFGLVALAATRLTEFEAGKTALRQYVSPRWWIGILGLATLIPLFSLLLNPWMQETVAPIVQKTVIFLFTSLAYLVMLMISPFASLITKFFLGIMGGLNDTQIARVIQQFTGLKNDVKLENQEALLRVFDAFGKFSPLILVCILLLGILLTVLWLRFQQQKHPVDSENIPADAVPGSRRKKTPNWLQKWGNPFNRAGKLLAAARIRQLYAKLLALSFRMGFPRPESATPLEFAGTLKNIFPANSTEIDLITSAYLKIRYGELPETQSEVLDVERAWQVLYKSSRAVLANIKKRQMEVKS